MATSFAELRKKSASSLQDLTKKVEDMSKGSGVKDATKETYWSPTVDKAGNGYAVIRFLPAPPGEDDPFVRVWDHGFQGPGGWYIEKSRTTLGEKDPVAEFNSELWNASSDDNSPERKQARAQKRRLAYHVNIYVVKDGGNPENEGKVFRYAVGKKIWDKLAQAMHPEFEDEKPLNPFDLWEGADFKLKIRKVEGYRNYDKSEFDDPRPLLEDDEKMELTWKKAHSLKELVDPKNFKSYDELKARLDKVLGAGGAAGAANRKKAAEMDLDNQREEYRPSSSKTAAPSSDDGGSWSNKSKGEDPEDDFFSKLGDD
jgi:hypothetical protein